MIQYCCLLTYQQVPIQVPVQHPYQFHSLSSFLCRNNTSQSTHMTLNQPSRYQLWILNYNYLSQNIEGNYKPHFEGIPQDYYPSTWCQIAGCIAIVLTIIFLMLMFLIVFLIWDDNWGTSHFVLLWSVVLIIFFAALLSGIYAGGRIKIRDQKRFLRERLNKMNEENKK